MIRIFFNSVIIYILLVILMRVIGKRQLGELELSELVVTILISEVAAEPIQDPAVPIYHAAIPVIALVGMEFLMSAISLRSVKFRAILSGKPALLIAHGRIDQSQMKKNRITPDELTEALRGKGVLDLREVEYAVLETNGQVSVIPTPDHRPATAGQMGVAAEDKGYPVIVINDGRVLAQNLKVLGRDENWLRKQLRENNISGPEKVYMMTADMSGGIYLAQKE